MVSAALCLVATGPYKAFALQIIRDVRVHFMPGHDVIVFIATDNEDMFKHYRKVVTTPVKRQGFPGDTLHRYHHLLAFKEELLKFEHVFYMDVDMRIVRDINPEDVCVADGEGLVATRHLHEFTSERKSLWTPFLKGTHDRNPVSQAFISERTVMRAYYAGGLQGGTAKCFVAAMEVMAARIDIDDRAGVVAEWHDESHWNKYLVDHPARRELDQRFLWFHVGDLRKAGLSDPFITLHDKPEGFSRGSHVERGSCTDLFGCPVFYINLDTRPDRRDEVEEEFAMVESLTRVDAVRNAEFGFLGCTESHIKALGLAWDTGAPFVAIIEDDAMIRADQFNHLATNASKIARVKKSMLWDVVLMSHVFGKDHPDQSCVPAGFVRVKGGQTTVAYIIRRSYIPVLRACFEDALIEGNRTHHEHSVAIDQRWKRLQDRDKFISLPHVPIIMRASYSDITKSTYSVHEHYK